MNKGLRAKAKPVIECKCWSDVKEVIKPQTKPESETMWILESSSPFPVFGGLE